MVPMPGERRQEREQRQRRDRVEHAGECQNRRGQRPDPVREHGERDRDEDRDDHGLQRSARHERAAPPGWCRRSAGCSSTRTTGWPLGRWAVRRALRRRSPTWTPEEGHTWTVPRRRRPPRRSRWTASASSYDDGTVAVGALSLDVPAGDLVVLIGPSGCGKSTILRMINRLIEPTNGRILLDGDDSWPATRSSCAAGSGTSSRTSACSHTRRSRPTSGPCRGCSAGRKAQIRDA